MNRDNYRSVLKPILRVLQNKLNEDMHNPPHADRHRRLSVSARRCVCGDCQAWRDAWHSLPEIVWAPSSDPQVCQPQHHLTMTRAYMRAVGVLRKYLAPHKAESCYCQDCTLWRVGMKLGTA